MFISLTMSFAIVSHYTASSNTFQMHVGEGCRSGLTDSEEITQGQTDQSGLSS